MLESEQAIAALVEDAEEHYYGKHRGFVVDNKDPKKIGRLKLRVPSVFGTEVVTGWAPPCVPYGGFAGQGFVFIPEVEDEVWVEFEEGNLESPIWVGSFWTAPDKKSEMPKANDLDGVEQDEIKEPVTRKIIKTRKGHSIQFEDLDGEESVIIIQVVDEENRNVILMNAEGIKVMDFNANEVVMNGDGIKLTDAAENVIEMNSEAFTITAKVPFTLDATGQAVKIIADAIDLTQG